MLLGSTKIMAGKTTVCFSFSCEKIDERPEKNASNIVETAYQDWLTKPFAAIRAVKSGDWIYTVDFSEMEQTNTQHQAHTVRAVRRVEQ
jgi:hypothetical protein